MVNKKGKKLSIIDITNAMAKQEDNTWNPLTMSWSSYNPNSLAQKNNNPLNLRFAKQQGAVLGAGGFAKFNTPEDGFIAGQNQINLDASRGLDLSSFIAKFAPPNENNTSQYLSNISEWLGISPSTKLSDIIGGGDTGSGGEMLADINGDPSSSDGGVSVEMIAVLSGLGLLAFKLFG